MMIYRTLDYHLNKTVTSGASWMLGMRSPTSTLHQILGVKCRPCSINVWTQEKARMRSCETRKEQAELVRVSAEVCLVKSNLRQLSVSSTFGCTARPAHLNSPTRDQTNASYSGHSPLDHQGSPMSLKMLKLLQFFQIIQAFFLDIENSNCGWNPRSIARKDIWAKQELDSPIILRKTIQSHRPHTSPLPQLSFGFRRDSWQSRESVTSRVTREDDILFSWGQTFKYQTKSPTLISHRAKALLNHIQSPPAFVMSIL